MRLSASSCHFWQCPLEIGSASAGFLHEIIVLMQFVFEQSNSLLHAICCTSAIFKTTIQFVQALPLVLLQVQRTVQSGKVVLF